MLDAVCVLHFAFSGFVFFPWRVRRVNPCPVDPLQWNRHLNIFSHSKVYNSKRGELARKEEISRIILAEKIVEKLLFSLLLPLRLPFSLSPWEWTLFGGFLGFCRLFVFADLCQNVLAFCLFLCWIYQIRFRQFRLWNIVDETMERRLILAKLQPAHRLRSHGENSTEKSISSQNWLKKRTAPFQRADRRRSGAVPYVKVCMCASLFPLPPNL